MGTKFPEKNLEISACDPLLRNYMSRDRADIDESENLSVRDPFDSLEPKFPHACFTLFSQATLSDRKPVPPQGSDVPAFCVKALCGPQSTHQTQFQVQFGKQQGGGDTGRQCDWKPC